jgi:coenzyme F420-0:L-glutamate ligase/coenzyme F420-1:gamma-L-glutamate ligase
VNTEQVNTDQVNTEQVNTEQVNTEQVNTEQVNTEQVNTPHATVTVTGIGGLPEIQAGADLAALITQAAPELADGDVLVVTSKIISKSEGQIISADRESAIAAETVRVVARRGITTIAETRHGFVLAAAGVDRSNTASGTVVLLPVDPDGSARRLRAAITELTGVRIGVLVTDTMGRPWRNGQTDTAIGAAGVAPLRDHRGEFDTFGNLLEVTVAAVADELAAAAELVKGKTDQVPVALVRGMAELVTDEDGPGAAALVRPAIDDMFRLGSTDVLTERRTVTDFSDEPVDPIVVRRAIEVALTAPAPDDAKPWRFAVAESAAARQQVVDAMRLASLGNDKEPLAKAPLIVVACLARQATQPQAALLISLGAAVENLLVALAVDGVGSCWVLGLPTFGPTVAEALDLPVGWEPIGAIAIGRPAGPPEPSTPPQDPGDVIVKR